MTTRRPHASVWFTWRAAAAGGAIIALMAAAAPLRAALAEGPTLSTKVAKVESPRITIDNFKFTPATLTVPAGTTVTWTNRDDTVHTVTASNRLFSSTGLDTGDAYSYTFATPGTYTYFCKLHPMMTATIVVK